MDKAAKAFDKAAATLERYKKNKTFVSPEDLAGKYRKSFQNLKLQLDKELEEYLRFFILDGLKVMDDEDGQKTIEQINRAWRQGGVAQKIRRAVFLDYDIGKVKRIAEAHREQVIGIYQAYFDRHTCLYAAGPSWNPDNPQRPLIYNDIVDKFYDEAAGGWTSKEKPPRGGDINFR